MPVIELEEVTMVEVRDEALEHITMLVHGPVHSHTFTCTTVCTKC